MILEQAKESDDKTWKDAHLNKKKKLITKETQDVRGKP